MQKSSKYIHLWKTRFFILTNHYLFAFTGIENDADCTMALDLSTVTEVEKVDCSKERKKEFIIRSITVNYFLRAENESIMNKWITELNKILNEIKRKTIQE